jgi:hypothetical protein
MCAAAAAAAAVQDALKGMSMGSVKLAATPTGAQGEACLKLLSSSKPGTPTVKNLANIQVVRQASGLESSSYATSNKTQESQTSSEAVQQSVRVAVPAPNLDVAGQYHWLVDAVDASHQKSSQQIWSEIQQKTGWVDGQSSLQSIYSPLEIEIDSDRGFF